MKLTVTEAEKILRRVFADEIGDGTLQIERDDSLNGGPRATSLDIVLRHLVKSNMKIQAIKLLRDIRPELGLSDAKEYVEKLV